MPHATAVSLTIQGSHSDHHVCESISFVLAHKSILLYVLLVVTDPWTCPLGDRGLPVMDRGDAPKAGAVPRRRVYPDRGACATALDVVV